jgi:hypothetical protein
MQNPQKADQRATQVPPATLTPNRYHGAAVLPWGGNHVAVRLKAPALAVTHRPKDAGVSREEVDARHAEGAAARVNGHRVEGIVEPAPQHRAVEQDKHQP